MLDRKLLRAAAVLLALTSSGCGVAIPQIQEVWEGVDVTGDMEFRIKQNIFCELIDALREVRATQTINGNPAIPNSYGVQMQVSLTVDEVGTINPGVNLNRTFPDAIVQGVTVPQSFVLGAAGTASSQITRTDTSYSYYNVGKISAKGANTWCKDPTYPIDRRGSSPLLRSNLGIADYLKGAVAGAGILHSSAVAKGGEGKSARLDVYSYEIKFIVITNASLTPTWTLVNITANTGALPLVSTGRTRTHDLTLTFGPGTDGPTDFALQTHFGGQIIQSNQRLRRALQ